MLPYVEKKSILAYVIKDLEMEKLFWTIREGQREIEEKQKRNQ